MMKKIAAAAVSAVMSALTLSGCGTANQAVNTASAQNIVNTVKEEKNTFENSKADSGYYAEFPQEITEIPMAWFIRYGIFRWGRSAASRRGNNAVYRFQ